MFAQKKVTLPPGRHKIIILDEADRWVRYQCCFRLTVSEILKTFLFLVSFAHCFMDTLVVVWLTNFTDRPKFLRFATVTLVLIWSCYLYLLVLSLFVCCPVGCKLAWHQELNKRWGGRWKYIRIPHVLDSLVTHLQRLLSLFKVDVPLSGLLDYLIKRSLDVSWWWLQQKRYTFSLSLNDNIIMWYHTF